ncbi:unnamed protein product [Arctogadus glacialis]
MLLEVKVALNFIVSYLYNKLPRRRADLFGEELERLLVARFEGHWYPEAPLRGSAFRCLHLGAPRDPVVELAARRSGLDTEEVRANVPAELSIWVDPYEVSYQIGEQGALKVLYLEDPPGPGGGGAERGAPPGDGAPGDGGPDEARSLGFNPDAQVFVPVGGRASPPPLGSLSASPTPGPAPPPGPALFSYPGTPTAHSSNPSTPSPPLGGLSYLPPPQQPPLQPITFTTASFAATKFGSTKMKKSSAAGPGAPGGPGGGGGGVAVVAVPPQRILSRSPPPALAPAELLKHAPLALALHALGAPGPPSQLSPNAKDYDPFARPAAPGPGGGLAYGEKPPFGEGLGGYSLQYPPQTFPPVVLAN